MLKYTNDIFWINDERSKQRVLELKSSLFYQNLPRCFGWFSGGKTAS